MRTWRGKLVAMLATTSLVLLGSVAIPAVSSAAQPSLFAAWESDSGLGTYTIAGAGNIADAVAADDGAFIQLDVNGWVKMAFPSGWYAIPDGTSAADLTVHTYDALFEADAEVSIYVSSGSTWVSAGVYPDTSDVAIDLDALAGAGPAHEVWINQGNHYIDPAYPTLGFDLNAVSAESYAPLHTTGTWAQYPVGAPVYQAQVQQPINSANTSNWSSKSKGGIPVMFKLLKGTGPAAFESIGSDTATANDWAAVSFTPDKPLTFADIAVLKTDYLFTLGNCLGGSLRWSVETATGNLFIYYGDAPNFADCTTNSQSGVNMIGLPDLRYDTSQLGGTFYDTYAHALTLMGNKPVLALDLVLDGGWATDQRATISKTTVNDASYDFVSAASALAPTCDLPAAMIDVNKVSGTAIGPVNEEPVQNSLTDTGNAFRVIDCKYQYVLSIPSLRGTGSYTVGVTFDGTTDVPNNAQFDLK